jgi:CubicO group peptidase (beta-lactamase class C family)
MTVLEKTDAPEPAHQTNMLPAVPADQEITIRDLFRHTSGFTYGFTGDTEVDRRYRNAGILFTDRDLEAMMTKLKKIPLLYQPGTSFHYSVSTDVLARVVEIVSGKRFDEYLTEHIFKPLRMGDTFFVVPPEKQNRFAQLYTPDTKGLLQPAPKIHSLRFLFQKNEFFSGGIGLCSTMDDYLRFSKMLLNRGQLEGTRVLSSEAIDLMFTDQLAEIKTKLEGFKFGLGVEISERGDYAWGGAAGTRFWVHPGKKMIVLFMTQILPYEPRLYGEQIRDIAYSQQ